ncbi:hypothetical protein P3C22_08055, partial [Pseudomonas sp. ER28]|uniref:hypothetical protein n=1 Tax=Pseudomonas sp. ER28 TaxID=3033801 RepID=UPI0023DE9A7C
MSEKTPPVLRESATFDRLTIQEIQRVQHNVLTLRGALVRDPKVWAHYLDQSLVRYGEQAEVVFAQ